MGRALALLLCLAPLVLIACDRAADNRPQQAPTSAPKSTAPARCEHQLPPSLCTQCNPQLTPVFQSRGDWCETHHFPESLCPVCRPDAEVPETETSPPPVVSDWCAGHDLPESMCTRCNPSLVSKYKATGDWCPEHGFPESACPHCNPQTPPAADERAAIEARVVRLKSTEIESAVGFETSQVQAATHPEYIDCNARVDYHADRLAEVRALLPGIVRRVRIEHGQRVKRGAPLFHLESSRVGEIQGQRLGAEQRVKTGEVNLARVRQLHANGIATARQLELSEGELAIARADLRVATASLRMSGAQPSTPNGRYTLSAPISGTVVRRPAIVGRYADTHEVLATIADTSRMWVFCEVPEAAAHRLRLGQQLQLPTAGEDRQGPVTTAAPIGWIAPEVDPRTRMVLVRAEVDNGEHRLRAQQFASARVLVSEGSAGLQVPRMAVQRMGDHDLVFVRAAPGVYQPRVIETTGSGPNVAVRGRLQAGEMVVTTGAILLRTEIMPGSIGAGCCEVEGRTP